MILKCDPEKEEARSRIFLKCVSRGFSAERTKRSQYRRTGNWGRHLGWPPGGGGRVGYASKVKSRLVSFSLACSSISPALDSRNKRQILMTVECSLRYDALLRYEQPFCTIVHIC